jgi:nitroimidazol reductase NimA-like FMN-containing flavoprotein (pyridoxamine 5'-phosphate oxidase superfamily)
MPKIIHQKVSNAAINAFKQKGIKLKTFETPASFEKELKKFLKKNHVLHLSTCFNNTPRSTPLEFRFNEMTFFILSEGGGKFGNLNRNTKVSFSIAEPYNSLDDYWSFKGVQAWGNAKIYNQRRTPKEFNEALKKMKIAEVLKKLGVKELPAGHSYRVVEIAPDIIRYGNPQEGVYWTKWYRKG